MTTSSATVRPYSRTELKFLQHLHARLGRHGTELRTGHIPLALASRYASDWGTVVNLPTVILAVVAAIAATGLARFALTDVTYQQSAFETHLVVALVGALGCWFSVKAASELHIANAALGIEQAIAEDQRIVAGLRGRDRRNALRELPSFSAPWTPPPPNISHHPK